MSKSITQIEKVALAAMNKGDVIVFTTEPPMESRVVSRIWGQDKPSKKLRLTVFTEGYPYSAATAYDFTKEEAESSMTNGDSYTAKNARDEDEYFIISKTGRIVPDGGGQMEVEIHYLLDPARRAS
ncbi:hypothetical protein V3D52_01590 [Pseudomonas putida]|uniref:hypothetical protein n=1 Tax=Pseudomonas putida TaxID=303 RepID=UPI0030CF09E4